ncbi:MAG: PIG-L family deacetylase [Phyllobacterium sp.]
MLTAHERFQRQKANPALIRLHRALSRLKSTVTLMNTGAHPDDEQSGLLACLRFGLGLRVIVACSTRGEGGQNALGPERSGALGVLRTREMEEAARGLDADIVWLGHGPDDPIHDFGFSKDGDQTFAHWGEERIIERLVRAYRSERPDIVLPTFLDVPGQHGHHRAMTRAAEKAIALAASPTAFPEHFSEGLTPWRVSKYYLPAWSGGGDTYDDEVPPPVATIIVEAEASEPATGVEYDRIGEWSRAYHASQGMGVWRDTPKTAWPLHRLHASGGGTAETSILDHIPSTLADLADDPDLPPTAREALNLAHTRLEQAIASFPRRGDIENALLAALGQIGRVQSDAPDDFIARHGHRLTRKLAEIHAALLEAQGLLVRACCNPASLAPGDKSELVVQIEGARPGQIPDIAPVMPEGIHCGEGVTTGPITRFELSVDSDASLSTQYPPAWASLGGNDDGFINICVEIAGGTVDCPIDFEEPLRIIPKHSVEFVPDALILSTHTKQRPWAFKLKRPLASGALQFDAPEGWQVNRNGEGWALSALAPPTAGQIKLIPIIDGRTASRITPIAYPHIGRTQHVAPETLHVLSLDLKLPENARIGYVGGGADRVATWLQRLELDVTEMDSIALAGDLSAFTTIIIGIFAFGLRTDLAAARDRLHRFVEDGGHLVTLYHRPSDGWNPLATPPRFLEIGSPSLRWRVTNPNAVVEILDANHPLLIGPNRIGPQDWGGWDKERGLYFASKWDDAYQPLLAMHDADEAPLRGALVSAAIGKGRHTHTSLVLHHQMDRLVPGAFRLMANLVQPARNNC